jgi:hypothetical protein
VGGLAGNGPGDGGVVAGQQAWAGPGSSSAALSGDTRLLVILVLTARATLVWETTSSRLSGSGRRGSAQVLERIGVLGSPARPMTWCPASAPSGACSRICTRTPPGSGDLAIRGRRHRGVGPTH